MWTLLGRRRHKKNEKKADVTFMVKSSSSTWSEEDKNELKIHLVDYLGLVHFNYIILIH